MFHTVKTGFFFHELVLLSKRLLRSELRDAQCPEEIGPTFQKPGGPTRSQFVKHTDIK